MLGLLAKAATLRKNLGLTAGERDEFAYDPDSGISREDQKEILQEIEKVATESRIAVSPEAFAVKAAKKGILFPVIVNAAAVFALVVGYFAFQLLFQRSETEAARESAAGITAAGKLIEELKKESEAQLQEKNAQINQIQGQLAQIDRERQNLQSTMDEKVRERETQLRAAVAAELDAERQKLRSQGLSDQDITRRLSELEARKNTEFTTELESYRRQADEERRKSEANLRALENEYTASLARANDERQKVLADSKKREEDLRAQLDQRTKELESDKAKAEAALRALASQKEKEDLATGQLVGMYTVAKIGHRREGLPEGAAEPAGHPGLREQGGGDHASRHRPAPGGRHLCRGLSHRAREGRGGQAENRHGIARGRCRPGCGHQEKGGRRGRPCPRGQPGAGRRAVRRGAGGHSRDRAQLRVLRGPGEAGGDGERGTAQGGPCPGRGCLRGGTLR